MGVERAEPDPFDPRVRCTDCQHFRPWRCGNFRAAGLRHPDVGPALSELPQRCPGFLMRLEKR